MSEHPYKSGKTLVKAIVGLFAVLIACMVFHIFICISGLGLVSQILSGSQNASSIAESIDTLERVSALSYLAFSIVIAFLFIRWMHRLHWNLESLGVKGLMLPHHSCIWGWFVPFVSLVVPVINMHEIWTASNPDSSDREGWRKSRSTLLITIWWLAYILFHILGVVSRALTQFLESSKDGKVEILACYYALAAVEEIVGIAAAFLAIAVVIKLTRRQDALHDRISLSGGSSEADQQPQQTSD